MRGNPCNPVVTQKSLHACGAPKEDSEGLDEDEEGVWDLKKSLDNHAILEASTIRHSCLGIRRKTTCRMRNVTRWHLCMIGACCAGLLQVA